MLEEIRRQFDVLSEQWRELVEEFASPPESFAGDGPAFEELMKRTQELEALLTRTSETLRALAPGESASEHPRSHS